ncbi:MAG TPA: hypothetical protein VFV89_13730 [Nocardioides sp.]|uniref:Vgb family protein n=1 Tax=Nocardioides sp. TaxID=35761 RepID=UPI002E347CB0|nr:hypothetical protein [Nocardioides sp.]HEX5088865.1 hypothetical protein [Nocardioides sp.]
MNLAELMNELAGDVGTQALPEPDEVRGVGDRLRRRQRNRLAAGAAALVVAAAATAVAVTGGGLRSAPEPVGPAEGWRVVRAVEVPGSGSAIVGDGSLWVVNMAAHRLTDDGSAPAGDLYQLDPESGDIVARIPEGVGGWPAVGGGAVWLMTAAGDLNVLSRVDLATHEVTRIKTTHPPTLPRGVAVVGNTLWVASLDTGELIVMDTDTLDVLRRIQLGSPASNQAPNSVVTDGTSVWVADGDGVVSRFDAATGRETSRLQLPASGVRLTGIDPRGVLYAIASDGRTLLTVTTGAAGAPDEYARTVHVGTGSDTVLAGVAFTDGATWLATSSPDQLLRMDPQSFEITGRTPLEGANHKSNVPVAIAATDDAVWVRVDGQVIEVAP